MDDGIEGIEAFKYYEVERVIQRRVRKVGRGPMITEYLVEWANYPHQYSGWVPATHMQADELIEELEA